MSTLAAAWDALTGPRVEDSWVEIVDHDRGVPQPLNIVPAESSSFEGGTVGTWSPSWVGTPGAVTLDVSTVRARGGGSRSMRITYPNAAAWSGPQWTVPTSVGTRYAASVWVFVPTGSPRVRFGDPFGYTALDYSAADLVDQWQRLTITWIATSANAYLVVAAMSATTGTEQVWVDDFRVVVGAETTDAIPAEEYVVGVLDGVTGCRVEYNVNATIRGGMSMSLRDVEQGLDWSRARFRPWVRVNDMTWPLGVFLPASPSRTHDEHGTAWDVPCLDKTSILDQDVVTATHSIPAGAVVTSEVAALIASTGESATALTESTLTTRSPMTWEPGTSKLRIINDLLDSINYFALWADRHGQFRAEPYRRPQDRTLAATFAAGEASIHSPAWSREQDIAGVPNRVVLIVEGDDENPGLTSVADNTDLASPYSIPRRGGRVVARVHDNVEAADQATLDALAAHYLAEASTPSATLSVAHATVPLDGNDAVRFADEGVDTLAVVQGWQVDLEPGALMTGTWREVAG